MFKLFLTLAVALITWPVEADDYRMIPFKELPQTARELIENYFSQSEVSYTTAKRSLFEREYKVYLADGGTISFDRNGRWSEIDCGRGELPEEMIPASIREELRKHFPEGRIREVERTRKGFEVKFRNGPEAEFDRRGRVIKVDD